MNSKNLIIVNLLRLYCIGWIVVALIFLGVDSFFFLSKSHYGIICIFLILLIKYCLNYPQASHLLINLQGQQCYSTSVLILKLRFFSLFVTFCCCFIWKSDNFIDFFSKDQLFFLIFLVLISLISTFHYFLNSLCVVSIWFHVSFFLIL